MFSIDMAIMLCDEHMLYLQMLCQICFILEILCYIIEKYCVMLCRFIRSSDVDILTMSHFNMILNDMKKVLQQILETKPHSQCHVKFQAIFQP